LRNSNRIVRLVRVLALVATIGLPAACTPEGAGSDATQTPQAISSPRVSPQAAASPVPALSPPVVPPDAQATPAIDLATVAPCTVASLKLGYGGGVSEATGQHTLALKFENISSSSCSLFGYPVVKLYDAAGSELPFVYVNRGDQMVTGAPPHPFALAPGVTGFVTINKYRCDLGTRSVASIVEIELPGSSAGLQFSASSSLGYCGPGDPGSTVAVSPLAATQSETSAH
jgi:Protein of unknown function (DUF4232)